jgi:hypothetical protein
VVVSEKIDSSAAAVIPKGFLNQLGFAMWTPTTRRQHSRIVTRYQTDLTDAESARDRAAIAEAQRDRQAAPAADARDLELHPTGIKSAAAGCGQCLSWVKNGITRIEHIFSALPPNIGHCWAQWFAGDMDNRADSCISAVWNTANLKLSSSTFAFNINSAAIPLIRTQSRRLVSSSRKAPALRRAYPAA